MSNNLPIQMTRFIGRQKEMADIRRVLASSRLLTLTGTGGSGKTRLAIEAVRQVLGTYKDGIVWVELTSLSEGSLVAQTVATTLGVLEQPGQEVERSLEGFLGDKQLLLVLDNCEHLIAASARLVDRLLRACPQLAVLATSLESLRVEGEVAWPVPPLSIPGEELVSADRLQQYEAVALFLDRARSVSPKFALTNENAAAVGRICRRLDGLPLALELAASRANMLTAQQIANRLDDRFTLLKLEARVPVHPRHQTLRATIDWSYGLLAADEQKVLRRIAVFEGGCSLETAELVCVDETLPAERIFESLAALVARSLVSADTIGQKQARYRMLESIRAYTLQKLSEAGELALMRDRHLDHFLDRAEEAAPKLNDSYQQLWLNWLEGEHDNLRAALAWSLENGRIEAGLRIATALVRFWEIRGYMHEGQTWFERLLAQVDKDVPTAVHANALAYASFLTMLLGDAETTMVYGQQAIALAEAAGGEGSQILIIALASLASAARAAGDFRTSCALEEREIRLLRRVPGQEFFLGMALLAHGSVAIELAEYETARTSLTESLAIAREAGDSFRTAHALNTLGDLARCEQRYEDAQTLYEHSEALLRELGAKHDLASVLYNLGQTCLYLGNIERAYVLFCESMAAHETLQNAPGVAECLTGFAAIALLRGRPAAGARLLSAAQALGDQRPAATSLRRSTRLEYERSLALAHERLTEAEFLTEQAIGTALSLERAVVFARDLPLKEESTPASSDTADSLTGREREVVALIGQGKTNSEIATELVVSKRTVETHVGHILSKLGVSSRGQIMLWAIDRGLTQNS